MDCHRGVNPSWARLLSRALGRASGRCDRGATIAGLGATPPRRDYRVAPESHLGQVRPRCENLDLGVKI